MANEKRLIDANALIDTIDNTNWYSVKDGKLILGASLFTALYMATDIYHAIETAPTVDAVEVVRCGNCVKRPKNVEWAMCHVLCRQTHKDDFCSYGERRTECE